MKVADALDRCPRSLDQLKFQLGTRGHDIPVCCSSLGNRVAVCSLAEP